MNVNKCVDSHNRNWTRQRVNISIRPLRMKKKVFIVDIENNKRRLSWTRQQTYTADEWERKTVRHFASKKDTKFNLNRNYVIYVSEKTELFFLLCCLFFGTYLCYRRARSINITLKCWRSTSEEKAFEWDCLLLTTKKKSLLNLIEPLILPKWAGHWIISMNARGTTRSIAQPTIHCFWFVCLFSIKIHLQDSLLVYFEGRYIEITQKCEENLHKRKILFKPFFSHQIKFVALLVFNYFLFSVKSFWVHRNFKIKAIILQLPKTKIAIETMFTFNNLSTNFSYIQIFT